MRYPVGMNGKIRSSAALIALLSCLACGVLAAASLGGLIYIPQSVQEAVANPDRPQKDRDRDVNRKPELVIAFAGIKPGQKVGELMPGGGYFTRIFCQIVGAKGHLYTVAINPVVKRDPPPPDAGVAAPVRNSCNNITADSQSAADFNLPGGLDVVWTSENYHDLHNAYFGKPDIKAFDTVIFNALKPGGVFIVEDHVAADGSGARDTETLHRIDPELVKQEVTSVGFEFEAASVALHNESDTHDAKVFELKGRSDKFLFKFRKPKVMQTALTSTQAGAAVAPVAGAVAGAVAAPVAVPVTGVASASPNAALIRVTGQKIIGQPGSADFVLQLSTTDGEVQYAVSLAELKNLASLAGKYSQQK
jgi:predicted methyltransferase